MGRLGRETGGEPTYRIDYSFLAHRRHRAVATPDTESPRPARVGHHSVKPRRVAHGSPRRALTQAHLPNEEQALWLPSLQWAHSLPCPRSFSHAHAITASCLSIRGATAWQWDASTRRGVVRDDLLANQSRASGGPHRAPPMSTPCRDGRTLPGDSWGDALGSASAVPSARATAQRRTHPMGLRLQSGW